MLAFSLNNLSNPFCVLLQCTIAHALEKTKYPDSDIFWKKFDEKYHFSCQFTADLIAMNHTDFIITSTFQEIAGRYPSDLDLDTAGYENINLKSVLCIYLVVLIEDFHSMILFTPYVWRKLKGLQSIFEYMVYILCT